jgi:hypothetical protein
MVSSRRGALGLTWWFRAVRTETLRFILMRKKEEGLSKARGRGGGRGGVKVVKEVDAEVHDER